MKPHLPSTLRAALLGAILVVPAHLYADAYEHDSWTAPISNIDGHTTLDSYETIDISHNQDSGVRGPITITNSGNITFSGNSDTDESYGGAIDGRYANSLDWLGWGDVTISNNWGNITFSDNSAKLFGGGIWGNEVA